MTQVALDHEFAAILDGCLEALGEEVMAVQEELARRGLEHALAGREGRVQDSAGGSFLYEWKVPDGAYDIRPDDAVRVRTESSESQGFVLSYQRSRGVVRAGCCSGWASPSCWAWVSS